MYKRIVCVIPARLKSTRFPKKMLSILGGKPLLERVWNAAHKVSYFDEVVFAIDAEETAELLNSFGAKWHMTSVDCLTGTDRLIELMQRKVLEADIWVNWQGDEPFITEQMIADLLQSVEDPADVWTLKKKMSSVDAPNPHIAKVVSDEEGFALYFSRSPIPYYRDFIPEEDKVFYKHIGMYAFSKEGLAKIAKLKAAPLELKEQLEQLRFLSNGLRIRVHETQVETLGIDLPEHLAQAEIFISEKALV